MPINITVKMCDLSLNPQWKDNNYGKNYCPALPLNKIILQVRADLILVLEYDVILHKLKKNNEKLMTRSK